MAAEAVFSLFIKFLLCFGNFMEMGIQKNQNLSAVNLQIVGMMQLVNIFGRSD